MSITRNNVKRAWMTDNNVFTKEDIHEDMPWAAWNGNTIGIGRTENSAIAHLCRKLRIEIPYFDSEDGREGQ